MKNIETILNESGVELTAEQKQAIATAVTENYKTIAEFEKTKEKLTTAQADLKKAQDDIKSISTEFEGKSAEQWKAEVDKLQSDWQMEKDEREKAEKAKQLDSEFAERFNAITADKKFANDYTKNGILADFRKAVESNEYKGKGDAEIYTELTKDRPGIYQGVTTEVLRGGNPLTGTPDIDQARAVMGLAPLK